MAVVYIQEFPIVDDDLSTTNYDAIAKKIADQGQSVEGLLCHTAGFDMDDNVFRIFDVWESREQADRFITERLDPIMTAWVAESGIDPSSYPPPTRDGFYELHDVIKP
jgi:hypothetical protein